MILQFYQFVVYGIAMWLRGQLRSVKHGVWDAYNYFENNVKENTNIENNISEDI